MPARVSVLLVVLTALVPASAGGRCPDPRLALLPPSGTALPPNPTLFFFVVGGELGDVPRLPTVPPGCRLQIRDEEDDAVPFTAVAQPSPSAFAVFALKVQARAGTRLTVSFADFGCGATDGLQRQTYRVVGHWRRPPRAPVRVARVENESCAWSCSHQLSRNLVPDRFAYAYKVQWAATAADWRARKRRVVVLPYSIDALTTCGAPPREIRVKLGFLNCKGFSFRWERQAVFVGLSAVHLDGSEDPPAIEPARIEPPVREKRWCD